MLPILLSATVCASAASLSAARRVAASEQAMLPLEPAAQDVSLTVSSSADGSAALSFVVSGGRGDSPSWPFHLIAHSTGSLSLIGGDDASAAPLLSILSSVDGAEKQDGAAALIDEGAPLSARRRSVADHDAAELAADRLERRRRVALRRGVIERALMRADSAPESSARRGAARRRLLSSKTSQELETASRGTVERSARLASEVRASGVLHSTGLIASTASGPVLAHGTRQWKMIAHDDFHRGTVEGWRNEGAQQPLPEHGGVSACTYHPHAYSDYFLGSYRDLEASKTFLLPAHTHVRIRARFHFIDDWQGESAVMKVDGHAVWTEAYRWCEEIMQTLCRPRRPGDDADTAMAINACGHVEFPDRLSAPIDIVLPHVHEELKITFGAHLASPDASWGVDDVMVFIH